MDKIFNPNQLKLINHKLNNFIAKNVFVPENKWKEVALTVPVAKMSGVYYVEKDTGFFELADEVAADVWADSRSGDWTSSSYQCKYWGRGWFTTKDDLLEADVELNLMQSRVRMATRHVDLRKEYECFRLFGLSASFLTLFTVPAVWVHTTSNTANNSTSIIQDVIEARRKVGSATAYTVMPNRIYLGGKVANVIGGHSEFLNDRKYTEKKIYKQYNLPETIQGCKVVVVNAVYEPKAQTQKKSTATKTKSLMVSDIAVVAYIGSNSDNTWITCFQRHEKRNMMKENNEKFVAGEVNEAYQFKVMNANYAVKLVNVEG